MTASSSITPLHGWTVQAVGGDIPPSLQGRSIPATVPGCVHLDLLAAGLIPDPYLDENERALSWVGRVDWRYEVSFACDHPTGEEVAEVVADGLDTFATVAVNGAVVGRTANMHRSYRFEVSRMVRPGVNTLAVTFAAALPAAHEASDSAGPLPHVNRHPYNAVRKMAANYGWDWGPELVTAGIWRPIGVQTWREARIAAVRPLVDVHGTTGRLRAHVDVRRAPGQDAELGLTVRVGGVERRAQLPAGSTSAVVHVNVEDVDLWWPHGYGDQPLYPVTVTLDGSAGMLDEWARRAGFRTVSLDTAPDEHGRPFQLAVNGVPLFVRGVNWIPDDCFPPRIGAERYAARLRQARDAHVNLVRVWGGGIYESDDFYDSCDELGLLVWQDFLFACAAYSEEEPMRGEVVAEAREAVTRLSSHASLVLWNGGNENIWGHADWGWPELLGGRTWGHGYYTELLPSIVAELDPTRPYSPGSPVSFTPGAHPNDPTDGTVHIWDVWNERDYTAYRDYAPRFAAEFGFQGPPTWATLVRSISDDPRTVDSAAMLAHQKAEDGTRKLRRGLEPHLPAPRSFDDWHWATSLNQARAVAFALDHFRSLAPVCSGAVVWQLNDCWPVTSWAAVDGDGRRKPLWYAMRRSFRDRLITVQPRDDGLAAVLVNDSARPWSGRVQLTRRTFEGKVLAESVATYDVAPRGTATVAIPNDVATSTDPASEVILAESAGDRAWWHFAEDLDAALPHPALQAELEDAAGGYLLHVSAGAFVRDLALLVDRVDPDASVDDMLVTLLPGETTTFAIRTSRALRLDQLVHPLVLRCSNQLVRADGVPAGAW